MIVLLISGFIGIILFEVPSLIRNKHWRELVVFSSLLLLAFILTFLQTMGIKVPLGKVIDFLIRDVLHFNYR